MKLYWEVPIPAELNHEREVALGERTIWAVLGPLDVPREVLVTREHQRMEFEFHYMAPIRERRTTSKSGQVRLTIGEQTGRVLSMEWGKNVEPSELAKVFEVLINSVGAHTSASQPQRRVHHYRLIAEDVLPWVEQALQHEVMRESR